jgi:NTE family protein
VEVFGVFEGGGAKGLAHVAAFAAAQRHGLKFLGVAGASGGAIVAALIAVGHRPHTLYDPKTRMGLLAGDLTQHLGAQRWSEWCAFNTDAQMRFHGASVLGIWARLPLFFGKWRKLLREASRSRGFFDTGVFEAQFEQWLQLAKSPPQGDDRLRFKHLDVPLKIIASDIDAQAPIVFSAQRTPDVPIARAVSASIAIPFFFKPVREEIDGKERTLVDGGLVANFPVWVFDVERRRTLAPTVGFRFLEAVPGSPGRDSLLRYFRKLMETAIVGDTDIHARRVDDLFNMEVEIGIGTLDFALSEDAKYQTYAWAASQTADQLLNKLAPKHPRVISAILERAAVIFKRHAGLAPSTQMRANLVVDTGRDSLRIVGSYEMEQDADDRLELEKDCWGCGQCWRSHKIETLDVATLRAGPIKESGLSKYQWALIRTSLQTVMSIPVFDPVGYDKSRPVSDNPLIGILNFDFDQITLAQLRSAIVEEAASHAAAMVSAALTSQIGA